MCERACLRGREGEKLVYAVPSLPPPSLHPSIAPSSCCYPWSKLSERKEGEGEREIVREEEEGKGDDGKTNHARSFPPSVLSSLPPSSEGAGLREMEDDGGAVEYMFGRDRAGRGPPARPPEGERVLRQSLISSANHNSMEG